MSAIATLTFGPHFAVIDVAAKKGSGGGKSNNSKGGKNNRKGDSGNGKKKGKKPRNEDPNPTPQSEAPCSDGACIGEFVLQDNREYREFICRQCDRDDPRDFYIVDADPSDPNNPMKMPVCCEYGEKCCGG